MRRDLCTSRVCRTNTRLPPVAVLALALATVPTGAGAGSTPSTGTSRRRPSPGSLPATGPSSRSSGREARSGYPATLCEPLSAGDQGLKPDLHRLRRVPSALGRPFLQPEGGPRQGPPERMDPGRGAGQRRDQGGARLLLHAREQAQRIGHEQPEAPGGRPRVCDSGRRQQCATSCSREPATTSSSLRSGLHRRGRAPQRARALRPVSHRRAGACAAPGLGRHPRRRTRRHGARRPRAGGLLPPLAGGHLRLRPDVGTWGSNAWRKGTHDYYNEFGIDTVDWKGRTVVAFGDCQHEARRLGAGLRRRRGEPSATRRRAAAGRRTRASRPVLGARAGGHPRLRLLQGDGPAGVRWVPRRSGPTSGTSSSGCPGRPGSGRGPPASLPRRTRTLRGRVRRRLPAASPSGSAAGTSGTGSVGAGLRLGFGAEGLTGSIGTGIAFLEAGFVAETAQENQCGDAPGCATVGTAALFPRVPARTGLDLGLRMPFWLIPGDMLILGPGAGARLSRGAQQGGGCGRERRAHPLRAEFRHRGGVPPGHRRS